MDKNKNKYNQDIISMIIADWQHGEWTECTCECDNCPLNKELPIYLTKCAKMTICNMLVEISYLLNEIEK